MRLRIAGPARRDLDEGYQFYESQEAGVGEYFLSSVRADIDGLRISAGIHAIVYHDYHRLLCRTFPFAVYDTKAGREVTIYAVVDCRRDPAWIRGHLQESRQP